MEGRDGVGASSGGVTVVGSDAPSAYHVAPRAENPNPTPGSAPPPATVAPPPPAAAGILAKKKRGRPRKYGPDGSGGPALSPRPISSAAPPPPVIDFSTPKRGKVKPAGSVSKPKFEVENLGKCSEMWTLVACFSCGL